MSQVEFEGEVSMKSGCRYTENGIEVYDVAKGEWEPMASAYEWVDKRTRPAKPNNKTMKYRVKTDQLKRFDEGEILKLADSGNYYRGNELHLGIKVEVVESNPDWFEPVEEYKIGEWVKNGNGQTLFRYHPEDVERRKGFNMNGEWSTIGFAFDHQLTKATTDEIEQVLVKEAKRRGLLEDNVELRWDHSKHKTTVAGKFDDVLYDEDIDYLVAKDGNGTFLYQEGKWPELVDQTPNIEINGNKVEFNEHPKVGCTTIKKKVFIEQAKTIMRHGIRIHRKGEDITDQILAIASHYVYETDLSNTIGETVTIEGTLENITFSGESMWRANE